MKTTKINGQRIQYLGLVLLAVALLTLGTDYLVVSYDQTPVNATVNITNTGPEILSIVINGGSDIDLAEGTTQSVVCNITIRDYNGVADIFGVNATFFDNVNTTRDAAQDNNSNYFLETPTCTNSTISANIAVFSCDYSVYYYAYNSTWACNATVIDSYNFTANGENTSTINPLFALNVTSLIDYGDMSVGDTSTTSETANITNFGNRPINISVFGWGGRNLSHPSGNGLAFICPVGNISIDNERYNITDEAWTNMINLTNESTTLPAVTVLNQHDDTPVFNLTYWKLYVPPNPFGQCNGTVVFEAELP